MAISIDGVLSEPAIRAAAGERLYGQGEDTVRYVTGLRVRAGQAEASVQARSVHRPSLAWSTGSLVPACTCRDSRGGKWCRHAVALGLAVIDSVSTTPHLTTAESPVDTYLSGLDTPALVDLVHELAAAGPEASRLLEAKAASATGDFTELGAELLEAMRRATSPRGFVDYRRSFPIASAVHEVLDELERLLDEGGADAAQPALLKALTATRRITQQADDSSGVLGDACARAAVLYARSCREGTIDGRKLARWLLTFRESSPGWPETPLEDFAPALGERGLAVYRARVADLATGGDLGDYSQYEARRMVLELADHDGDVDGAVALLTDDPEHAAYGAAIDRLVAVRREDDALAMTDRAVAAGRIGTIGQLYDRRNEYWLDPLEVATRYRAHGREQEALDLLRRAFARTPGRRAYDVIGSFADAAGVGDAERQWARGEARRIAEQPHQGGQALVEIALGDDDLDAAWAASDEFGPGGAWERLAEASKEKYPRRAIDLHLAAMQPELSRADRRAYTGIARHLKVIRDFYDAAGAPDEFEDLVTGLRETYRRRPSFLAELDKARLPGA